MSCYGWYDESGRENNCSGFVSLLNLQKNTGIECRNKGDEGNEEMVKKQVINTPVPTAVP